MTQIIYLMSSVEYLLVFTAFQRVTPIALKCHFRWDYTLLREF